MIPVIAHPKPRRLYIFWAIPFDGSETNYYKVVAVSEAQARFFWRRHLKILKPYDYGDSSCGIDVIRFTNPSIGDVYGDDARV